MYVDQIILKVSHNPSQLKKSITEKNEANPGKIVIR